MARVPVLQTALVAPEPLSRARLQPADNNGGAGGGIARGLMQLGKTVGAVAEDQAELDFQIDDLGRRKLALEFQTSARPLIQRYQALEGNAALVARPELERQLAGLRSHLVSQATSTRMRGMFEFDADAYGSDFADNIATHASKQLRVEQQRTYEAQLTAATDGGIASRGDPAAAERYLETGYTAIEDSASWRGLSTDGVVAERAAFRSQFRRSTIASMLAAGETDQAIAYRNEHDADLGAADRIAVDAALRQPLERRQAVSDYETTPVGQAGRPATEATAADAQPQQPAAAQQTTFADPLRGAGREPVQGGNYGAARDYGSHNAVDIPAARGTSVFSAAPGTVTVSHSANGGNIVSVDHGNGRVSRYMHLDRVNVKTGDTVTGDTQIGTVGMTGRTSGPHLHWEARLNGRPVDPRTLIGQQASGGAPSSAARPGEIDLGDKIAALQERAKRENWPVERLERAIDYATVQNGRQEQAKAEDYARAREQAQEAILAIGPDNYTNFSQIPAEVRAALSPADRLQLTESADTNRRQREQQGAALSLFNSGQSTPGFRWNPFDRTHQAAAEAGVRARGGTSQSAFEVWQQTGILTPTGLSALRGDLASNDRTRVRQAVNIAANMLQRNPNAFAGVEGSSEIEKAGLAFNHYVTDLGISPSEAAARVQRESSPEFQSRVRLTDPQRQEYQRQVSRNGSDDPRPLFNGAAFANPQDEQRARQSFNELIVEEIGNGHDLATARGLAAKRLQRVWGVTRGGKVMQYPPEAGYPQINGSHNYLFDDARATVIAETGGPFRSYSLVPVRGVTDEDFRRGRPPRYRINYSKVGSDGQVVWDTIPGYWAADVARARTDATRAREDRFQRQRARGWQDELGIQPLGLER